VTYTGIEAAAILERITALTAYSSHLCVDSRLLAYWNAILFATAIRVRFGLYLLIGMVNNEPRVRFFLARIVAHHPTSKHQRSKAQ